MIARSKPERTPFITTEQAVIESTSRMSTYLRGLAPGTSISAIELAKIAEVLDGLARKNDESYAEGFRRGVEAAADQIVKHIEPSDELPEHELNWLISMIRALRPEGEK